jgi:hypothetical protein
VITRLFSILDAETQVYYLVNQIEDVDREICEKIGLRPGFKIVNRFSGRYVDGFAGYRFVPGSSESIETQSKGFDLDGTATAFGHAPAQNSPTLATAYTERLHESLIDRLFSVSPAHQSPRRLSGP